MSTCASSSSIDIQQCGNRKIHCLSYWKVSIASDRVQTCAESPFHSVPLTVKIESKHISTSCAFVVPVLE